MSNLAKKGLSSEEKQKMISDWRLSGLSKKKFAEEHGLKYCTFIGWFQGSKQTATPGFTEVVISTGNKLLMEVVIKEKTVRFYQPLPKEYFLLLLQ